MELRNLTKKLEILEDRREFALNLACIGIWDMELESGKISCDDNALKVFGITREQFMPTLDYVKSLVIPGDAELLDQLLMALTESSDPVNQLVRRKLLSNNEVVTIRIKGCRTGNTLIGVCFRELQECPRYKFCEVRKLVEAGHIVDNIRYNIV